MSLPPPAARSKKHTREILLEGFARDDGDFDVDAWLTDTKTSEFRTGRRLLAPGEVLHGLGARMTFNRDLEIVDFIAVMDDTPSVACDSTPPFFKALIGVKIGPGFVKEAYARVGGTMGCTHIREMLQQMATVAFQTLFQAPRAKPQDPNARPALLDSCHGWRAGGDIIRSRFPAFYQREGAAREEDTD